MPDSLRPGADEPEPQSRRATPSIGLRPEATAVADSSQEDFLFHLYRGSELLHDNRVHEAKEELERALHLQPRDAQGNDLLGVVYFRLGMYPRAITIFEQLRRKNPRDTALLLNLSLCYLKTGQPGSARSALEQLLEINPAHVRAWGYLGLACERVGDLVTAERAFRAGGHDQMAKRIAERRSLSNPPPPPTQEDQETPPKRESREAREAVATAFKELDAGELSFALAEPSVESDLSREETSVGSWKAVELGSPNSPRPDTQKPDTKDGPPPVVEPVSAPQLPMPPPTSRGRRPTLIVGAAPDPNDPTAHEVPSMRESGVPGFDKIPSPKPPTFTLDEAGYPISAPQAPLAPSIRRPAVAVPVVRVGIGSVLEPPPEGLTRMKTLPPPLHKPPTAPPPPVSELAAQSSVDFPSRGGVVVHPSGVALVRTTQQVPAFCARLESMRASSNGLAMKLLERQMKGKPTGESFGGVGSPMVSAVGEGQLVLAPRPGRRLSCFVLADEMCFVREEVLLGFEPELAYENGRLATGEGEFVSVVQLRGKGAVLLEAIGDIITLDVKANRGISVRREVILGWFGRLVPRALAPSEAPCGQRGLVSFAGDGRVLLAGA